MAVSIVGWQVVGAGCYCCCCRRRADRGVDGVGGLVGRRDESDFGHVVGDRVDRCVHLQHDVLVLFQLVLDISNVIHNDSQRVI